MEGSDTTRIERDKPDNKSDRVSRGYAIFVLGNQVRRLTRHAYRVHSQSNGKWYPVKWNGLEWDCECPDHIYRQVICKHIHAVKFSQEIRRRVVEEARFPSASDLTLKPDACPKCNSIYIVKKAKRFNARATIQRYLCKSCGFRFSEGYGLQKIQHFPKLIVLSLDLYFKGVSLRKIVDHAKQFYGVRVGKSTVQRWIRSYVALMKSYTDDLLPQVSDAWHADDMMVKVKANGGRYHYLWNLMDHDTRFLIASRMSTHRTGEEAKRLFKQGTNLAAQRPKLIITDELRSYKEAYEEVLQPRGTTHLASPQFIDRTNNNRVERLHGTVREREKTMRALGNNQSAQTVVEGFRIYYNWVKPHMALNGRTPAEVAGVGVDESNRWVGLIKQATKNMERRK